MESLNRILDLLIMVFVGYEVRRTDDALEVASEAKLQLELNDNHTAIEKQFAGESDIDVVNDAIRSNSNK